MREGHLRQGEQRLQRLIVPEDCCHRGTDLKSGQQAWTLLPFGAATQPGLSSQRRKARGDWILGSLRSLPRWPLQVREKPVLVSSATCPRRVTDR